MWTPISVMLQITSCWPCQFSDQLSTHMGFISGSIKRHQNVSQGPMGRRPVVLSQGIGSTTCTRLWYWNDFEVVKKPSRFWDLFLNTFRHTTVQALILSQVGLCLLHLVLVHLCATVRFSLSHWPWKENKENRRWGKWKCPYVLKKVGLWGQLSGLLYINNLWRLKETSMPVAFLQPRKLQQIYKIRVLAI